MKGTEKTLILSAKTWCIPDPVSRRHTALKSDSRCLVGNISLTKEA